MATKALSAAQLQAKVKLLETSLAQTEAQLKDRQRLLEYTASLLLEIDTHFKNSTVLSSLPKKINFWWLIANWRTVLEFIEFVVQKIKEFVQNVKVERNATT